MYAISLTLLNNGRPVAYEVGNDAERINTSRVELTPRLAAAVAPEPRIRMFGFSAAFGSGVPCSRVHRWRCDSRSPDMGYSSRRTHYPRGGAVFLGAECTDLANRGMSTIATTPRLASAISSASGPFRFH